MSNKKHSEGTKFHELVSKIVVHEDGKLFKDMLDWVKSNKYLRIIQKKGKF